MVGRPPEILGLLAEPIRWHIVQELGRSDRRVGELVASTGKPQNLVSYHLSALRKAGLVNARRSSADGRDVYYSADFVRCRELLAECGASLHPAISAGSIDLDDVRVAGRPRLLFLCTGNSARSQMAEALAVHRSGGRVTAASAGSHPKAVHANAVRVLAERGIDISAKRSKPLERFEGRRFDRVITLCDKVREVCPEFSGARSYAHWSIPDPAASGLDDEEAYPEFRAVADEIDTRITLLLADLAAPVPGGSPNT